jgi:SAM-dependent methyltransferase
MELLLPLLDPGNRILDLGCGCGIPLAESLSDAYSVTGVDISPVQIARARKLVPDASFICADMTMLDFQDDRFDAVTCLYAIIHVPLEEQQELIGNVASWLRPGGTFLCTVGHREWTGTEEDWLGVEGGTMYWSHADESRYADWLTAAGFAIRERFFIPEGKGGHTVFLASSGTPDEVDKPRSR